MKRIFAKALAFVCTLAASNSSFAQDTITQTADYYQAVGTVEKVLSTNNFAGNFNPDSATTLPYGIVKEIGVTRYVIAIDSAMFAPGKATFSAYMALEFPGSTDKIAFAAKNVAFNPKGVIPGNNTRLALVSEHHIRIGPNTTMVLQPDGGNYVEWDCNGFKGVKLKGFFEFGGNMLTSDSSSGGGATVKASFDVYTADVHNFIAQVSISPFYIKGLKDVSFTVVDAVVDMSEYDNASGMVFPPGYDGTAFGSQISLWTGFFIKQLKIRLPKELGKNEKVMEVAATDFLIDKSGVSGHFSATNIFTTSEGKMGKWPFSVDMVGLTFVANQLVGGALGGKIILPASETESLAYSAMVFHNQQTKRADYTFTLSPATAYKAKVLSATIDIYPTSKLIVQKINGAFKPSAELNGKISFQHNYLKLNALEMQQVCITDEAPYLKGGTFSFTGLGQDSSAKLSGFQISLSSITLGYGSNAPVLSFAAGVNFTDKNDNAFGAQATFAVVTKLEPTGGTTAGADKKWAFDKIKVNDVGISVHTNAFKFDGTLHFKSNDAKYGNGFFGSLSLRIDKLLDNPVSANVWFGNVNDYTYYYFDLAIPATVIVLPAGTVSPQGIAIYRFMGGLYYHMRPAAHNLQNQLYTSAFNNARNYIPDKTRGIGLKAGVTLGTHPTHEIFNGDVALELLFTGSGGLGSITISGNAFMMVKINERVPTLKTTPPVKVAFALAYDHENRVFHALLNAKAVLPSIKAEGQAEFHIDPSAWYIHFGKPNNRVLVNLASVASVNAYIMLGNKLEPMPPPPQQVLSIFGHGFADTRDAGSLHNGTGLVMGASLGAGSSGSFGWDAFSVYYDLGFVAGFDVMVVNYGTNAHCSGSSGRAGLNGWYAQGQVYAALWGAVGAKGKLFGAPFDVQLLSISAAAMLSGKFPNPSSIRGDVAVNYEFLNYFKGHFDFSFRVGQDCSISG